MVEPLDYANPTQERHSDSPQATVALVMCGLVLAATAVLNISFFLTGKVSMCAAIVAVPLGLPLLAPLYLVPSAHIRREPLRWWATGGLVVAAAVWWMPIVLLRMNRGGW